MFDARKSCDASHLWIRFSFTRAATANFRCHYSVTDARYHEKVWVRILLTSDKDHEVRYSTSSQRARQMVRLELRESATKLPASLT